MTPIDVVILLSCLFSLFGGLLLMFTCLAPSNRKKHARELLFWLSLCDVMTSLAYMLSISFYNNDFMCKTTALISIFFPVASFLWVSNCVF